MGRILHVLTVTAVMTLLSVGVVGGTSARIAHADVPPHSCQSTSDQVQVETGDGLTGYQAVNFNLNNGCYNYVNGTVGFVSGPGCDDNGNTSNISSSGWTQGSAGHAWFHCTYDFPVSPQCAYLGSPGSTLRFNEYMDVYSSGPSSMTHHIQSACV